MNRIQFMSELAALLQDIPVVERQDAMKFYNDYFDDAGEENEQEVIAELESPAKVAATIKEDLGIKSEDTADGKYSEYRETGYTDTRFEEKRMPAGREEQKQSGGYRASDNYRQAKEQEPPKSSPVLKVILIIAIVLVGAPVILPVGFAVIAVVIAGIAAMIGLFIALVAMFIAFAVTGVVLFFAGIAALIPEIAVGLALIGTGLILGVLGVVGTIGSVKLCIVAIPGIFRGIVWLVRKPFEGRAVA